MSPVGVGVNRGVGNSVSDTSDVYTASLTVACSMSSSDKSIMLSAIENAGIGFAMDVTKISKANTFDNSLYISCPLKFNYIII
ncbi:MAG: hypothetical protein BWY74_02452 [Firmicutes bacterium ADurb.Bin419]|nr:MAG: hypothetical protein BWY74_02452 [Firmicutes bacterium ADurb.Bin419]